MTYNDNWSKAGGADRTEFYRTWRTQLGHGAVGDADQVEYTIISDEPVPVAVLELSVADPEWCHPDPSPLFLEKVLDKLATTRPQGMMLRHLAERLQVPLYAVVPILDEIDRGFWVYNVTASRGWRHMSPPEYVGWLRHIYRERRNYVQPKRRNHEP